MQPAHRLGCRTRSAVIGTFISASMVYAGSVFGASDGTKTTATFGWNFEYDQGDRITKVTDPAGRETRLEYSFDAAKNLRRVARLRAEEPAVTREFDEAGRLQSMSDRAGTVDYRYDQRGRLNGVHRQDAPAVTYAYDAHDRITLLQVGNFYRVDYGYDYLGRLTSMKTPVGHIRYEYLTGQGSVQRTLPNGIKTIWQYEPNGQLRQITHADARNVVLAQYTYQHRADGLIEAILERTGSDETIKTYGYDPVGRLVKANGPSGPYLYEYDAVGNRLKAAAPGNHSETYAYDRAGRLKAIDGKKIEHDLAGNVTSMTTNGATLKYRHNGDGQLTEVLDGKVSYQFDGDGRIISRDIAGIRTTILSDPISLTWRPLEIIGDGTRRRCIFWDGAMPLVVTHEGQVEYLLHDHLESVRLVTDSNGNITKRADYQPFGAALLPSDAVDLSPQFAGLLWDSKAQKYLTLTRAYSPDLGRFIQFDSKPSLREGFQNQYHAYNYAGADPVNWKDMDGRDRVAATHSFDRIATDWVPKDIWFHDKVRSYVDAWSLEIPNGHDLAIVFLGINNRWEDAGELTRSNFDQGKYTIVIPTYAGSSKSLDAVRTGNDYLRTAVPRGFPSFAISPFPIQFHTRKIGVPELLGHLESRLKERGIGVKALVFESGANFLLQENIGGLIVYARTHRNLPEIGVLSGSISERVHGKPLKDAGYVLANLGEYGNRSVDKLVPALERRAADFAPFRIAPLGIPGYLLNVYRAFDAYGADNTLLSDKVGSSEIPLRLFTPIDSKVRGHGYKARRDLVDSYLMAIDRPIGFRMGVSFQASSVPLSSDEINAWRKRSGMRDERSRGSNFVGPSSEQRHTSLDSSPVGGVYLSGAGQTLDISLFNTIVLDRNNNIFLIGQTDSQIKLPLLRFDDLVTVFRSVYLHGEGPSVTIDPSPENPEGSAMIIRHGKATENTYVGWVLYQADRLMKGYTLGIDNITTKAVGSAVPGYEDVLNTIYFGGESLDKLRKSGIWERFWIVPAQTRRFVGSKKELTLFDVPLEVRTQSMKWVQGKLVDNLAAKTSPGALAFKTWFTANYEPIARERYLTPPRESGIVAPVPVFTELRRIALMTAIAEKLRDQGVPLPFWMRDYQVRPVPFEKTTPGLEVKRSKQAISARIYGGVNLSVADKDIKNYATAEDAAAAPPKDAVAVRQNLTRAGALEEAVRPLAASGQPITVRTFSLGGATYQAATLPGAQTLALAPARLEEVDLMAPVAGREPIRLVRSYNSFFNPTGPWGRGWALDLPRLDPIRLPLRRTGKGVEYQVAYELITPLNSIHARFSRVESVPTHNGSRLQVPDQPGEFLGIGDAKPEFLSSPTLVLIRKDGGRWHFSKSGELVATERSGSRMVYERDEKRRLTRIVALLGKRPISSIELRYDAIGRVESATAKSEKREVSVRYEYDSTGKLAGVVSGTGWLGYRYEGPLLTEITAGSANGDAKRTPETTLRRFQYGPGGRVLAETSADGTKTDFRVTADANGSTVTAAQGGKTKSTDSVRYDPALRPVEARYADGTQISWSYPSGGETVMDLMPNDGRKVRLTESADARVRTVQLGTDRTLVSEYDGVGRLTSFTDNGQPVLQQTWSPDGRLLVAGDSTAAAHYEYDPDGLVSRVLLAPRSESGAFKTWQATKLDSAGRPLEVTDSRGLQASLTYGSEGDLRSAAIRRDGKNYGFQINRDELGRVREVKSSWDTSQYAYDQAGMLSRMEVDSAGRKSHAEWKSGRLQKVRQFDGGEFNLSYYQDPKREGLPKEIVTPNRLVLGYDYDASNRLSQVAVGSAYRVMLEYDTKGRLKQWKYAPQNP